MSLAADPPKRGRGRPPGTGYRQRAAAAAAVAAAAAAPAGVAAAAADAGDEPPKKKRGRPSGTRGRQRAAAAAASAAAQTTVDGDVKSSGSSSAVELWSASEVCSFVQMIGAVYGPVANKLLELKVNGRVLLHDLQASDIENLGFSALYAKVIMRHVQTLRDVSTLNADRTK